MRILLVGVAALALTGCSKLGHNLGMSGSADHAYYSYGDGECCAEGQTLSRWNIEAGAGPEFIVGGDLLTPEDVHANPGVVANALSMDDAFDPGVRYELGGSYAINPNRKVTLTGSLSQASGEQVDVGTINGNLLTGRASDYERLGLEAGLRQYFAPKALGQKWSVRPYVEGRLGAAKVKDIDLEGATLGGAAFNGGTAPLYEGGWVGTAAGLVGLEAPVFKRATLGLETGIRYTGAPKSDTSVFSPGFGLAGVNNDASSLTVPVMLRGRYRF